ncbi:hypothetical protein BT96DRAFT_1010449 [Gymnopus androsaceus JB14]|uniref:Uncharacterized protein n=1 Tax=Gymnopus androsaceus JB14 TaxID=1447944 RepID=A0A6A4GAN1_9AGAR|nr:hypothetical protein BT96DRAFT_1010449 [Gymnopus androsaceus JB14]
MASIIWLEGVHPDMCPPSLGLLHAILLVMTDLVISLAICSVPSPPLSNEKNGVQLEGFEGIFEAVPALDDASSATIQASGVPMPSS